MLWSAKTWLFALSLLVIGYSNVAYAAGEYCISYTINSVPQVDCQGTQAACEAVRGTLDGNSNIANLSSCYPQGSNPCADAGNQCVETQFCNNPTTIGGCGTSAVCCDMREPGTVSFVQAVKTVPETAGLVTFDVRRTGGGAAVSVTYRVEVGTKSGSVQNFSTPSGTLSWGVDDTSSKSISIAVSDDDEAADPDVAVIILAAASGNPAISSSGSLTVTDDERDNAIACIDAGYMCKPPGACKTTAPTDAPPCTDASGDVCCADTYEGDVCSVGAEQGTCVAPNGCDGGTSGSSAVCGSFYTCCVPDDADDADDDGDGSTPTPARCPDSLGTPPADVSTGAGLVSCGNNVEVQCGVNAQGQTVYRYIGECTVCDFQKTLLLILNFLVTVMVAVAGILFANAGFYYLTAQGNAAKVSKAHNLFMNTLAGLVIVLAAYLLIDVLMKTLVSNDGKINGVGPWNELLCDEFSTSSWYDIEQLDSTEISVAEHELQDIGGGSELYRQRQDVIEEHNVPDSGYCSEAYLASYFPASQLATAACVCWHESNGRANIPSGVDKCKPSGEPASWGLFQINLTAHPINGLDCPSAISGGAYTASNHTCAVRSDGQSQVLWESCTRNAINPTINIQKAVEIQQRSGWGQWGAYHRHCE